MPSASLTKEGEMEYSLSRDGGEYGDGMLAVLKIISRVWLGLCGDVLLSGCWKKMQIP